MRLLDRPRPKVDHAELIVLPFQAKISRADQDLITSAKASRKRSRCSTGTMPFEITASDGNPVGNPATRRPPLMQSSMAYSSAMRVGGVVDGKVEPSWTMATSWPLVAFASTAPMIEGLAMKP